MLLNDNFAFLCLRFSCLRGIILGISAEINLKIARHFLLLVLAVGDVCKGARSEQEGIRIRDSPLKPNRWKLISEVLTVINSTLSAPGKRKHRGSLTAVVKSAFYVITRRSAFRHQGPLFQLRQARVCRATLKGNRP